MTEIKQILLDQVERLVSLNEKAKEALINITSTTEVKKKDLIVEPAQVAHYRYFVTQGSFRSYLIDSAGKEHTVQLVSEGLYITDFCSHLYKYPATLYVEALEDSIICKLHYNDVEALCQKYHAFSEYFRLTTQEEFSTARHRALAIISKTAEERFLDLSRSNPEWIQRIPQKVIASYLGMTPEFLSKIRRQLSTKS